jgi:hypothetical protein
MTIAGYSKSYIRAPSRLVLEVPPPKSENDSKVTKSRDRAILKI